MTRVNDFLKDELLNSILETSCELVWVHDLACGRFSCVAAPEKRVKFSVPENATENDMMQLIHPDDRQRVSYALSDLMADRYATAARHEYRACANGEPCQIREKIKVVRDRGGKATMTFRIWEDVSHDRHREETLMLQLSAKEEELHEASKFVKAFERSPDPMVIVRHDDLVLVEANSRLEALTGYSKAEMLGKPVSNFPWWLTGKEIDIFSQGRGAAAPFEGSLKRKDNSRFFAAIASSDLVVSDERYVVVRIRDISESRCAARKLLLSEANLRATINNSNLAIWSVDRSLRLIAFNGTTRDHIKKCYGFELQIGERMLGMPGATSQFVRQASNWVKYYKRALKGEAIKIYETHGGRTIDFSVSPIRQNGRVMGVSVFGEDVTDRIAKENELLEIKSRVAESKLMALRSAMNPHFIFNALNSIQFFISSNERRNAINYLSMFSKLVRGILVHSVQNKVKLVDELDLLKHYIDLELLRFENKFSFELDTDPSLDLEAVEIPSLLIQPYVENAIIHGLYNRDGHGLLKILIEQEQEGISITIEDNGVGRRAARALKERFSPQHKSLGTLLTEERLNLINQFRNVSVDTEDLFEFNIPCGTKVKIWIDV